MKIKVEMIIDLGDNFIDFETEQEFEWFEKDIINAKDLHIHSNEIGDELGEVLEITKWSYVKS